MFEDYDFLVLVCAMGGLAVGGVLLVAERMIRGRGTGIGWLLIAVGLLFLALLGGGIWGFVGWSLFVIAWMRGAIRFRQSQKQALWAALSLAADKQVPLAPMAFAFADEQRGSFSAAVRNLARQLESGASLAEAIAWCPGTLPPEAALAARIGSDSGDLPGAVRATGGRQTRRLLISPVALWLLLFVPSVVFVKVKVEPALKLIFDDFETSLPSATIVVSRALESPVFFYAGLALATLAIVVWLEWRGTLAPRLPGLKKVLQWTELAQVLRTLSLSIRHGRPLPQALETIGMLHPTRWVRRRVRAAARDLSQGAAWQECLLRRRLLGTNDLAVLTAAERNGNLPWALEEMGQSYARRADFQLKAWAEFAFPLLVALAGIAVGMFVIGYFMPLIHLINSLA